MLLSGKYKLGFVHIPKTAGTSLRNSIEHLHDHFSESALSSICRKVPGLEERWPFISIKHYTHLSIARLFTYVTESQLDEYRFFAVSRHPVKWLISYYSHILRHHRSGKYAKYFPEKHLKSFDAFIAWYLNDNFAPLQTAMLTNSEGVIRADYIAKQELLDQHIAEILGDLGISNVNLPRKNTAPSGLSISPSQTSINLIEDYFESDYKILGYDSSSASDIVMSRGQIILKNKTFFNNVPASKFDPWETYTKSERLIAES